MFSNALMHDIVNTLGYRATLQQPVFEVGQGMSPPAVKAITHPRIPTILLTAEENLLLELNDHDGDADNREQHYLSRNPAGEKTLRKCSYHQT